MRSRRALSLGLGVLVAVLLLLAGRDVLTILRLRDEEAKLSTPLPTAEQQAALTKKIQVGGGGAGGGGNAEEGALRERGEAEGRGQAGRRGGDADLIWVGGTKADARPPATAAEQADSLPTPPPRPSPAAAPAVTGAAAGGTLTEAQLAELAQVVQQYDHDHHGGGAGNGADGPHAAAHLGGPAPAVAAPQAAAALPEAAAHEPLDLEHPEALLAELNKMMRDREQADGGRGTYLHQN